MTYVVYLTNAQAIIFALHKHAVHFDWQVSSSHRELVLYIRYCSKATSQTHATFCDLRARIERNECVLSMRTSLDFRILYAKMNVAKESSATGCKYIDRFIRRRVFFVNLAQIPILQRYKGLSSVRFVSRVACESEHDTSKDNRSFATLPLSSTVGT